MAESKLCGVGFESGDQGPTWSESVFEPPKPKLKMSYEPPTPPVGVRALMMAWYGPFTRKLSPPNFLRREL